MCQLMGISCNKHAATTFSFTGFSARGGLTSDHVDGWGIAFYDGKGCRVFQDDQPASQSPLADYVRQHPIKAKVVVAHVRKATQGDVHSANCHPFQREWLGRTWVFAHNGDLGRFEAPMTCQDMPVGTTDCERAFCALMSRLRLHFKDWQHPPEWPELAPVLASIAQEDCAADLRWQALREGLGLDTAGGFAALARVAGQADDPLAAPAAALEAQLLASYPALEELA